MFEHHVLQCQRLRLLVYDSPAWQCQRRYAVMLVLAACLVK